MLWTQEPRTLEEALVDIRDLQGVLAEAQSRNAALEGVVHAFRRQISNMTPALPAAASSPFLPLSPILGQPVDPAVTATVLGPEDRDSRIRGLIAGSWVRIPTNRVLLHHYWWNPATGATCPGF